MRHKVGVGHRAGVEYRAGVGLRSNGGTEDRGWTQSSDGAPAGVGHRAGTFATSVRVNQSAHTHLLFVSLYLQKMFSFNSTGFPVYIRTQTQLAILWP